MEDRAAVLKGIPLSSIRHRFEVGVPGVDLIGDDHVAQLHIIVQARGDTDVDDHPGIPAFQCPVSSKLGVLHAHSPNEASHDPPLTDGSRDVEGEV